MEWRVSNESARGVARRPEQSRPRVAAFIYILYIYVVLFEYFYY